MKNNKLIKNTFKWIAILNVGYFIVWALGKLNLFSLSGIYTNWDIDHIMSYVISNCVVAITSIIHYKSKGNNTNHKE